MSRELFNTLLGDIQEGRDVQSSLAHLTEEQIDALFQEAQPFKALGTASSEKIVLGSVSNLREKYLKKLITTALVGFLFQMKDEHSVVEEDLTTPLNRDEYYVEVPSTLQPDYNTEILYHEELAAMYEARFPESDNRVYKEMETELSEDDLLEVNAKTTARYSEMAAPRKVFDTAGYDKALDTATKTQEASEQVIINKFLKKMFQYDPETHVQPGEQERGDDPERRDLDELKGTDAVYDNIPSNDTHCRFNAYYEINYEKMRQATHDIYNVKPDLEHAMIVYGVMDTQTDVDNFIQKYGASSKYDILSFPQNRWTLMGPFKENRERVDYYNKHNTIIKQMLDQQEKDAALGEDLMKNRVKTSKAKAEKVFGKDSPAFDEYRKLNPSELSAKYNASMEEMADGKVKVTREVTIDSETGRELKTDEDGVPDNALEIPVMSINAKTGETSQTRFFSAASN